jgi:hypothetical protein
MTSTENHWAARRRGELPRDRGSLRLWPAIDARRRLNTRRAERAWTKADPQRPERRPPRLPDAIARPGEPSRIELDNEEQIKEHVLLQTTARAGDLDCDSWTHVRAAGRHGLRRQ